MDPAGGYGLDRQTPVYRFPAHLFIILALLLGGLLVVSIASASESPCGDVYVAAPGDTLSLISIECETSLPALLDANPGINPGDTLTTGQLIQIPANDFIPDTGASLPSTTTYTVVSGDTLSSIAAHYNTTVALIHQANPQIANPNLIYPGQVLTIPGSSEPSPPQAVIPDTGTGEVQYSVRRGDTLSGIALRYGIPTGDLIARNTQIANPDLIYPEQVVIIPGTLPPAAPAPASLFPLTQEPSAPVPPTPQPTPVPTIQFVPPPDVIPDTGEILIQDDFSTPGDWHTSIEQSFQMEYAEGGYRILNNTPNTSVSSIRVLNVRDVHVEISAARVGGPQTGFYGVVCRWQDIQNYYALVIGSDGFYSIARISNGQLTHLSEGRATAGPVLLDSAANLIGGSCIGDTLTLSVNGHRLLQVQDQTFAEGNVGVIVATRAASGTHVHFYNFKAMR